MIGFREFICRECGGRSLWKYSILVEDTCTCRLVDRNENFQYSRLPKKALIIWEEKYE